jgi:hypothetical protein
LPAAGFSATRFHHLVTGISLDFHSGAPRIGADKKSVKGRRSMRSATNGGLVRITGVGVDAANEEPAAERVRAERHREDRTAGWDPYEVWRTRVKEPRVTKDEPGISDPHDRRR